MSNRSETPGAPPRQIPRKTILPETPRVHLGLFGATMVSVMLVYVLFWGGRALTLRGALFEAFLFTCALLAILLSHELGHYLAARYHGIEATLPFFIPAPIGIGTFGAFIQIRGKIRNRTQLLDVGAAGPLAGMAVAFLLAIGGIYRSEFFPLEGADLRLGESLLFKGLIELIKGPAPQGWELALHPIGFAAWIGFLITALNLMPASQLDGGHVVYALFGKRHSVISRLVFLALVGWGVWGDIPNVGVWGVPTAVILSIYALYLIFTRRQRKLLRRMLILLIVAHIGLLVFLETRTDSSMWLFWGGLLYLFRLDHPPTQKTGTDDPSALELSRKRIWIGVLALVVFLMTFMPQPIQILEP